MLLASYVFCTLHTGSLSTSEESLVTSTLPTTDLSTDHEETTAEEGSTKGLLFKNSYT